MSAMPRTWPTYCAWGGCRSHWIAPAETRELRELVRYRAKLVAFRSGLKAQVHAVLAKAGVLIAVLTCSGSMAVPSSSRPLCPAPMPSAWRPC